MLGITGNMSLAYDPLTNTFITACRDQFISIFSFDLRFVMARCWYVALFDAEHGWILQQLTTFLIEPRIVPSCPRNSCQAKMKTKVFVCIFMGIRRHLAGGRGGRGTIRFVPQNTTTRPCYRKPH